MRQKGWHASATSGTHYSHCHCSRYGSQGVSRTTSSQRQLPLHLIPCPRYQPILTPTCHIQDEALPSVIQMHHNTAQSCADITIPNTTHIASPYLSHRHHGASHIQHRHGQRLLLPPTRRHRISHLPTLIQTDRPRPQGHHHHPRP